MDWKTNSLKNQNGKTFLITGANPGLGFQTALELAKKDALIIMAGRSVDKIEQAILDIKKEYPVAKNVS